MESGNENFACHGSSFSKISKLIVSNRVQTLSNINAVAAQKHRVLKLPIASPGVPDMSIFKRAESNSFQVVLLYLYSHVIGHSCPIWFLGIHCSCNR